MPPRHTCNTSHLPVQFGTQPRDILLPSRVVHRKQLPLLLPLSFFFFFLHLLPSFVIPHPIMALGLRTKTFGFIEGENEFVSAFQWFNKIDNSDQWQRGTYYALCVAYTLVSFIALVSHFLFFYGQIINLQKNGQVLSFVGFNFESLFPLFRFWSELIYYITDTPSHQISTRFKL